MRSAAANIATSALLLTSFAMAKGQATFKGHSIGEDPTSFFKAEPKLKAKLDQCQGSPPRPLTDEEVRRRFGNRRLKELEKQRVTDPSATMLDQDPDLYGDRCGALLEIAAGRDVVIDGVGSEYMNHFYKHIEERKASGDDGTKSVLTQGQLANFDWFGREGLETRVFTFKAGKLECFSINILAPYRDVVEDAGKKLGAVPKETLIPMHNAMGAVWDNALYTWNVDELHAELSVDENPASDRASRLTVETKELFLQKEREKANRPSTVD